MVVNFYVEIPPQPQKEKTPCGAGDHVPGWDCECGKAARTETGALRHPKPSPKRVAAIMRQQGPFKAEWLCPSCPQHPVIAIATTLGADSVAECSSCGKKVVREELPVTVDLFRLRTGRTDGVEIISVSTIPIGPPNVVVRANFPEPASAHSSEVTA